MLYAKGIARRGLYKASLVEYNPQHGGTIVTEEDDRCGCGSPVGKDCFLSFLLAKFYKDSGAL